MGAFHFLNQSRIIRNARHDGHVFKVLGRRTHHRRAADVDVLDQVAESHAWLCSRFLKRIQVHHHHIDRLDAMRGHGGLVLGVAANVEKPAVYPRVQRLHAAVQHLRKAGQIADVFDGQPRLAQRPRGSASGNQLYAMSGELPGEVDEARFIGHADERSMNGLYSCAGRSRTRMLRGGQAVLL